ncbi:MAG: hypothetical protein MUC43_09490 [Pirellula sp.]|jgi:hypothetical protein|nr:hypothetical protein [Pirellula sp.]
MKASYLFVVQILLFATIALFGIHVIILLTAWGILAKSAFFFCFGYGRYIYLVCSVGLLLLSLAVTIVSADSSDGRLVVTHDNWGRKLFRFWMLQNTIIGTLTIASLLWLIATQPKGTLIDLLRISLPL